jgi:hypothetical protein
VPGDTAAARSASRAAFSAATFAASARAASSLPATKVAKWHLNFPTSNISAERGCADLRGIEAMWQRARMAHDTIGEVKFVFNRAVLVRMVERELAYLNTL